MNSTKKLTTNVENEINNFHNRYTTMEPIQIYNDWYIIGFYESVNEFLAPATVIEYLSDEIISWLSNFENPISFLYNEWLSYDEEISYTWSSDLAHFISYVYDSDNNR